MSELTGRVRRQRSWRTWGPGAALAVAFLALLVVSWAGFDPTVSTMPQVPPALVFGLIGTGAVFMVIGVVSSWKSGNFGGPRHSPTSVISSHQQRRCLDLVHSVDQDDPAQVRAASDLARRISAQRGQGWGNAAFVLLMLSLTLDGSDLLSSAAVLLVLVGHLGLLVTRELRVQAARRFLRTHGRPAGVVTSMASSPRQ